MKKLIINGNTTEKRIAVIENEEVVELRILQPNQLDTAGNIYSGRVIDVIPGMQAAFVDIGLGKNGFIHRDQLLAYQLSPLSHEAKTAKSISSFVQQGQEILVQVVKEAAGGKGPKLTGIVEVSGSRLVYIPNGNYIAVSRKMKSEEERNRWKEFGNEHTEGNEGLVIRTACEDQQETEAVEELNSLRKTYDEIVTLQTTSKAPALLHDTNHFIDSILHEIPRNQISEIVVDDLKALNRIKQHETGIEDHFMLHFYNGKENIFTHFGIDHEIEKALKKIVWLKSGAYIIIEKTEALTIIDVNTGKFQGKTNLRDTVLKTNIEAGIEIARQIRLRDLGGMILVDFIDMKIESDKKKVMNAVIEATKNDRNRVRVAGFTQLGILEMTRKKVRQSLSETLQTHCTECAGTGRVFTDDSVAYMLERELCEYKGMEHDAVWVETTEAVKHVMEGKDKLQLKVLEQNLHFSIHLTVNQSLRHSYVIRHLGSQQEVMDRIKNNNG